MHTYHQTTGEWYHDGELLGTGYSGFEQGKNNPALQAIHDVGPIPRGLYMIGHPQDLNGGSHGPYVLPLSPDPGNEMAGRSGFLLHGDSLELPGFASRGCIIQTHSVRVAIAAYVAVGQNRLQVTA